MERKGIRVIVSRPARITSIIIICLAEVAGGGGETPTAASLQVLSYIIIYLKNCQQISVLPYYAYIKIHKNSLTLIYLSKK